MSNFLPRRKLSAEELSIIPEALFQLLTERIKVSFVPARKWMPKMVPGSHTHLSYSEGFGFRTQTYSISTMHDKNETKYDKLETSNDTLDPESSTMNSLIESSIKISGVINGLSTRTPWRSTCLVKALAAHKLLEKRGISSKVHFGVKKDLKKGFEAHAWLSVAGKALIGGENLTDYNETSIF